MPTNMYCSVTGITDQDPSFTPISVRVSGGHDSSTTVAIIETIGHNLSIGNRITIDLGYTGNHKQVFTGFVKSIERKIPENTYIITANDDLVRAFDYFIVSSDPEHPLEFSSISAEELVSTLMTMAGISSYSSGTTGFLLGVNSNIQINQVSSYDYSRSISDLLTWHLWCDEYGTVHFKNRKPFAMEGSEPQVDWVNDTPISYGWSDNQLIEGTVHVDDQSLRNRIIVYGADDIHATAEDSSSPYFHWKIAVLVARELIGTTIDAQKTADYNLHLLNHLNYEVDVTVMGNPNLLPHRTINVQSDILFGSGSEERQFYIFSCEHNFSTQGYITHLGLRRIL